MYRLISVFSFFCFFAGGFTLPSPVKACGLKLAVRESQGVKRSFYPTTVHVYTSEEATVLQKTLMRAGHKVILAKDTGAHVKSGVVLADKANIDKVRKANPGVTVVPIESNARASVLSLESELTKKAEIENAKRRDQQG